MFIVVVVFGWIFDGYFSILYVFLFCVSSVVIVFIVFLVLGMIMIGVIIGFCKIGINLDNVVIFIVVSLGDFIILVLFLGISWGFYLELNYW